MTSCLLSIRPSTRPSLLPPLTRSSPPPYPFLLLQQYDLMRKRDWQFDEATSEYVYACELRRCERCGVPIRLDLLRFENLVKLDSLNFSCFIIYTFDSDDTPSMSILCHTGMWRRLPRATKCCASSRKRATGGQVHQFPSNLKFFKL